MMYRYALIVLMSVASIAGCAGYSPNTNLIGQDRTAVLADMGQPEREYAVDGFRVMHFPRGPAGKHTYFIYLDGNDRVMKWEQVLTEDRFETILPGMTKDQVIGNLGVTKITNALGRNRGYVWHYRYDTPHCNSFVVEFTQDDIVRSAGIRTRSGRKCKFVGLG
jgi:hypothetical protein